MHTPVTRRDAIKTLGAGAALLGLGLLPTKASAASTATPQPFALPPLGFAYDALEPHFDARTMEIHHTKHHQAYITNANRALADFPELQTRTAEEILRDLGGMPEKIRTALRNNVGGHVNHSFFWAILAPGGAVRNPDGALAKAVASTFGSDLEKQFADAAMKRFGSGWAWLSAKADGSLLIHSTANQDSPLSEGLTPILGLDVWEHAYYLHYQNRRADYVAAFWKVVNWSQAEANYAAVSRR